MRTLNLLATSALCFAVSTAIAQQSPHTALLNGPFLARAKATQDPTLLAAIRAEADTALRVKPASVVDKALTPPSGDKHDYMSMAPYFWPNPDTPNHLPYIHKDGEHNPEIKSVQDHDNLSRMAKSVQALALGYYFTGNEAYAKRASLLLHVWYLDPATHMNPNMDFAQAIMGVNNGRGGGIIDARDFPLVLDGVALLAGSSAWSAADDAALHQWFTSYLTWLTTNKNARQEAATKNNHGNWFDQQVIAVAFYLNQPDRIREDAEASKTHRIATQIQPNGEQPLEEARTMSFHYSAFSLEALMRVATIAQLAGVDTWTYTAPNGASIRTALDFMIPFALGKKEWKHANITGLHTDELRLPLFMAAIGLHDPNYEAVAKSIKGHESAQTILLEQQFADQQAHQEKQK